MTCRDIDSNSEEAVHIPFMVSLCRHGQCDAEMLTVLTDIRPFPFFVIALSSVRDKDIKTLNRAAEFTRQFNPTGLDFGSQMKHRWRIAQHFFARISKHPLSPGVNEIDHPVNVR